MLGKRAPQRGLVEADQPYLEHVGRDSFDGFLAGQRGRLFRDEDFAALYCPDNGRPSVPPSRLATALLLQTDAGVSDEEAKARADFDLRGKVALGIGLADRPFAESTLQLFRAQLVLHDRIRAVFQRSLAFARETGYFTSRKIRAVLDTSYILGRGAVKDTDNLLADGIGQLIRALARRAGAEPAAWAAAHGRARYVGTSLKGEAAIDGDDPAARQAFLRAVVADADRLLDARGPAGGRSGPRTGPGRRRPAGPPAGPGRRAATGRGRAAAGGQPGPGRGGARPRAAPRPQERDQALRRAQGRRRRRPREPAHHGGGGAARQRPGPRAGARVGRADRGERGGRGRGDGRRLRLRRQRHAPGVRRGRAHAGGDGPGPARAGALAQGGLPDRPGRAELHPPGRPGMPERGVDRRGRARRRARRPAAGVPVRRRRLRRLPAAAGVRAGAAGARALGAAPPAGGPAPGGARLPAQRRLRPRPAVASGRRAPAGAADAARHAPGARRRPRQDALPAPAGRHRRESDPRGDQGGPAPRPPPHGPSWPPPPRLGCGADEPPGGCSPLHAPADALRQRLEGGFAAALLA